MFSHEGKSQELQSRAGVCVKQMVQAVFEEGLEILRPPYASCSTLKQKTTDISRRSNTMHLF